MSDVFNSVDVPACHSKWNVNFNISQSDWKKIHSWIFNVTNDTYLQWLQTRLVHRILATNALLFKMNLSNTSMCTFCKKEPETLLHLFWDCNVVKKLMIDLTEICRNYDASFETDCQTFILGSTEKSQYNILFIEIKRFIYLCRRKEILPSIRGLIGSLKLASSVINTCKTKQNENLRNWKLIHEIIA